MRQQAKLIAVASLGSLLLTSTIFFATLILPQTTTLGPIENIHGIPYANQGTSLQITEELAHVDVFINRPAFAQEAHLTIRFNPYQLQKLTIGIRENSFWLSYPQYTLYEIMIPPPISTQQSTSVTIPLTDKIQESDQSLDLMFFATPLPESEPYWILENIQLTVNPTTPTWKEIKNFGKAVITRERVL